MHVVLVNERADFVGGAERHVADVAQLLRARGVRCTLLYGVPRWMEPGFTSRFDEAFPLVATRDQLARLAPDVVYLHQLADRTLVGQLAESGPPVVRFFHDHRLFCLREHKYTTLRHETCRRPIGVHCYPCLGFVTRSEGIAKVRLRTLGSLRLEHRAHDAMAGYVVGSNYMRGHLIDHGFARERIRVVPPFVQLRPMLDLPRDRRRLLFVGALLRGKGLDVLLRALTQLARDVTLRVVGAGHQGSEYVRLVAELGLTSRVQFVGSLGPEAVAREHATAGCLVVPSREPETFGLIGPEALLQGTPVVASDVGGMGEWLIDGVTGRAFASGDAGGLGRVLTAVMSDWDAACRLAAAGRERCLQRFAPDVHADALLGLFAELAARKGRS